MARLPYPGGDAGQWGEILNEFLSQSIAADGSLNVGTVGEVQLKSSSVTTAKLADGAVTPSKLAGAGGPGGPALLDGTGTLPDAQVPMQAVAESPQLAAANVAQIEDDDSPVGRALSTKFVAQPGTAEAGQGLIYDGTSWVAGSIPVENEGVAEWAPASAYAADARVLNPFGQVVIAKYSHTSTGFYDATKWAVPSFDGATVFDFTQLPDGPLNTARPTRGSLDFFGIGEGGWREFRIRDGRLESVPEFSADHNIYFQGELNSKVEPVQHAWVIADCAAVAEPNQSLLILLPGPEKWWDGTGDSHRAAIHSPLYGDVGAGPVSQLRAATYGTTLPGRSFSGGPVVDISYPFQGRRVRYDVTLDKRNGAIRYYIDNVLVAEYVQPFAVHYMSPYAMFELNGPTWKVLEFGLSPYMPEHPPARGKIARGNASVLTSTITTTWQKIREIDVFYDETGAVEVTWDLYVNNTAGRVQMEIGDTTNEPTTVSPYQLGGVMDCRAPFYAIRSGTPMTHEKIAIWARVTGSGAATATIRTSTQGGGVNGPRWSAVVTQYRTYQP